MKIKFIGAVGGDVTGSCILCCARNGTRFLVDCGTFQGGGFTETKNIRFPFDPKSIDFVLLTHAHSDHCGRIPDLYRCGFVGKIICNEATRDLAILNILDRNKAGLSEKTREIEKKKWEESFITEKQRPEIANSKPFRVDNDLQISVLRSSHFLGSVGFSVTWNLYKDYESKYQGKTICFSGDLGAVIDGEVNHLPLLKDGFVPFLNTDYIVMESTYGARTREMKYKNFEERINHLDELISTDEVDTFVFACFSMQRTQDILFDLLYLVMRDDNHHFSIILDSSMSVRACDIYKQALMKLKIDKKSGGKKFVYLNENFVERFFPLLKEYMHYNPEGVLDKKIHMMRSFISAALSAKFERSNITISFESYDDYDKNDEKLTEEESKSKKIYITSSGMLQYGPILKHFRERYGDERTAFFITGFCKSTDNGKIISAWLNGSEEGGITPDKKGNRKIFRNEWKAKIYNLASYYSGHADAEGLLRFLFYSAIYGKEGKQPVPDKKRVTVFLNHGDVIARAELKKEIEKKSEKLENQDAREIKSVMLPMATDPFFDLDNGEWDPNPNDLLSPVFMASSVENPVSVAKKRKKIKAKLNPLISP